MVGKEKSYPDEGQRDINPRSETRGFLQSEFLSLNGPILQVGNTAYISHLFAETRDRSDECGSNLVTNLRQIRGFCT